MSSHDSAPFPLATRCPPFLLAGDTLITPFDRSKHLTPEMHAAIVRVKRLLAAPAVWVDAMTGEMKPADVTEDWIRQRKANCAAVKR